MNKYTKPTFMLASLGVTALGASSCGYRISDEDKEILDAWDPGWKENGFNSGTECSFDIEAFCKFTASENLSQAFSS